MAQPGQAQHRRQDRPGEAEDEQERADVAEQEVLGHVRPEELVGQAAEGDDAGDLDEQPAEEAGLPPAGDGPRGPAQGVDAQRVEDAGHRRGRELQGGEDLLPHARSVRAARRAGRYPAAMSATPASAAATPTACTRARRSRRTIRASRTVMTGYSEPTTATMLRLPSRLARP